MTTGMMWGDKRKWCHIHRSLSANMTGEPVHFWLLSDMNSNNTHFWRQQDVRFLPGFGGFFFSLSAKVISRLLREENYKSCSLAFLMTPSQLLFSRDLWQPNYWQLFEAFLLFLSAVTVRVSLVLWVMLRNCCFHFESPPSHLMFSYVGIYRFRSVFVASCQNTWFKLNLWALEWGVSN